MSRKPPPRAVRAEMAGPTIREHNPVTAAAYGVSPDFPHLIEVDVDRIDENSDQPRSVFDQDALRSLADSIDKHGLQQPILVAPTGDASRYRLVAGERRLRAHKMLGRKTIFAIITRGRPEEIALIENVQRVDLDAVDLARGLDHLIKTHGYTQEAVGALIGIDRTEVNKRLTVLELPDDILAEYHQHADRITRSALIEVAAVKDEKRLRKLWSGIRQGGFRVTDVRAEKRKLTSGDAEATGATLREIGRSLVAIRREVGRLAEREDALAPEHLKIVAELRDSLDTILKVSAG